MAKSKPAPKAPVKARSRGPRIEKDSGLFQVGIVTFYTAFVMLIVRMGVYDANMEQFYWSSSDNTLVDFFSLIKSETILILTVLAAFVLLYRVTTQSFTLQKTPIYIPMLVYALFVALSFAFSSYKEFALLGWNDRFEGTLVLIAYMVMLLYIVNTVKSERNVRWIINPLAFTATILGFIGLSQYYIMDFFKTDFGRKLITPSTFWDQLDKLNFNFEAGQIYQTVFNPNYVSFYLTLLVPLFGMLFIRESRILIKICLGFCYGLFLFNLIGSASSNGIVGLAVSFILAIVILNKRLLEWKKPVLFILIITAVVGSLTFARFLPELAGAIGSATQPDKTASTGAVTTAVKGPVPIDYFETGLDKVTISISGNVLNVYPKLVDGSLTIELKDGDGKDISIRKTNGSDDGTVNDPRFDMCRLGFDSNEGINYLILVTGDKDWPFALTNEGIFYRNIIGKLVTLTKTPHFGFEKNLDFGSSRGYIWSRSFPFLKDTLIVGKGADTYCLYFPQNDYAGRYAGGWTPNIIVDKAHNMYLATALNTGVISLLALLTIFGIYLKQSFPIYKKANYADDYLTFCGCGIFIGVAGFLVSAIFNDSSVSVMPLFYGLLGTGFAINRMLKEKTSQF